MISDESKQAIQKDIKIRTESIKVLDKEISGVMKQISEVEGKISRLQVNLDSLVASKQNSENKKTQILSDIDRMETDIGNVIKR